MILQTPDGRRNMTSGLSNLTFYPTSGISFTWKFDDHITENHIKREEDFN